MKIRVLVIDDFPLVREGYVAALGSDPDIEVVGEADSGPQGLEMAHQLKPDVATVDLFMPGGGGIPLIRRIREELPDTGVLVVTASERAESLLDAIAAGAAGYITKQAAREEFRQAVITVHGGGSIITPALAGHLLREYSSVIQGDSTPRTLLTRREQEVLRLVADGLTDREIGERLYVSPRTVQNHLASVREKTGLRRRSELVRWASRHSAI